MTSLTRRWARRPGSSPATPSAPRTSSPSAWSAGSTPGPPSPPSNGSTKRFAETPAGRRGQHPGLQGRASTSARRPSSSSRTTRSARPPSSPASTSNVTGNTALAWGLIAAAQLAELPLFLGSYPITPASDILHELSRRKEFGVRTFQAEDEIAGVGAALGAAFGGSLGVTTTSGPGLDLKSETDRAGRQPRAAAAHRRHPAGRALHRAARPRPSRPTCSTPCTAATARRPLPIVAAMTPSHCFEAAIEAVRHRRQVPHAGDPALRRLPGQRGRAVAAARRRRPARRSTRTSPPSPTTPRTTGPPAFWPYVRDEETLARPWAAARGPRPRAPHRRPGEGRRLGQRLLRPGQPRADGPPAGGQGRRHRPATSPRLEVDDRDRRRRRCWCSAGARPTGPSPPGCAGCGPGA